MRALAAVCLFAVAFADDNEPGAGKDVVKLTADNFDAEILQTEDLVLVEVYAPWCGHCKNLAPEWAKAATALKGIVKLAALDATEHKEPAEKLGAQGYPTIKAFPLGKKIPEIEGPECEDDPEFDCAAFDADKAKCESEGDEEKDFLTANSACCICGGGMRQPEPEMRMEDYNGGRTADDIIDWVYGKLEAAGVNITVPEATSDEDFTAKCLGKKYCIVAILPHLYDTGAAGRNQLLDVIGAVAKAQRAISSVVWVQAGNQEALEEAFSLNSGFPAVVAINKDRKRYGTHAGPFTPQAIQKTLRTMQSGLLPTSTYADLPKISKTEPWDGGDYKIEEEDEDY